MYQGSEKHEENDNGKRLWIDSLLDHVQDALVISQLCCDQIRALMLRVWDLPLETGVAAKTEALRRAVVVRSGSRLGQSLKIKPPTVTALIAPWLLLPPPPATIAEDMMMRDCPYSPPICTKSLFCGRSRVQPTRASRTQSPCGCGRVCGTRVHAGMGLPGGTEAAHR